MLIAANMISADQKRMLHCYLVASPLVLFVCSRMGCYYLCQMCYEADTETRCCIPVMLSVAFWYVTSQLTNPDS